MKAKLFLSLCASILLFSCDLINGYGKKVEIGSSEVYYKSGATEAEARKLGNYLKQEAYFNDSTEKSVQLLKEDSGYLIKLVVDKGKLDLNNQPSMNNYWLMQATFSDKVFNGSPVKLVLADTHMKDIQAMEKISKLKEGQFTFYVKGEGINPEEAKGIAKVLKDQNYFGTSEEDILLKRSGDGYHVSFIYNKAYYDASRAQLLPAFQMMQWLISENVFNNAKTDIGLSDAYFVDFETVPAYTQQEKAQLLKQASEERP